MFEKLVRVEETESFCGKDEIPNVCRERDSNRCYEVLLTSAAGAKVCYSIQDGAVYMARGNYVVWR